MAAVSVVPVENWHIASLPFGIRSEDRLEIAASHGVRTDDEILKLVWDGVQDSLEAKSLFLGDDFAMIYGVQPGGIVWAIGTTAVRKHKADFWRASTSILPYLTSNYGTLRNSIHSRNIPALRWAKAMGFRLGAAKPTGQSNELFHPFTVSKEDLCAHQQSSQA